LKEQEFFAQRNPWIANAPNAAERKKRIVQLMASGNSSDKALHCEYLNELRKSSGWTNLLKESGRYPFTGHGRLNTYAVFAETARAVITAQGRSGLVLPTGIATDATTAPFFSDLVNNRKLIHVYGFRNNRGLFKNVGHGDVRFCLLAFTGRNVQIRESRFAFDLGLPGELADTHHVYSLSKDDIILVNPNTGTCPTFKSRRDADITIGIYRHVPVLWRDQPEENSWDLSFMQGTFNMASDSRLFHTREKLEPDGWTLSGNVFVEDGRCMLPLYEGKMIYHFDHRFGDYRNRQEGRIDSVLPRTTEKSKANPNFHVLPRYWVDRSEVDRRLARRGWNRDWLLGWRDITRSTDERTIISSIIPRAAVGDKYLLAFTDRGSWFLQANLSSFILDYCARQKHAGSSFKYFLFKQLPILPPVIYQTQMEWLNEETLASWIQQRVLELTYTAYDLSSFATDLGDDGPPFQWNEERRFAMRAELDAAFFPGIRQSPVCCLAR